MDDVAGLLATLAGMAAIIAVGALQLRHPAVSHVEVTDVDGETRLVVRLPTWDAIWAMKRSVTVPLLRVAHVTASDAAGVPGGGCACRAPRCPG